MEVRVYTILVGRGGEVPMPVQMRDPFTLGGDAPNGAGPGGRGRRAAEAHRGAQTGGEPFFSATDSASPRRIFERIDRLEKSEIKLTAYRALPRAVPALAARGGRPARPASAVPVRPRRCG